MNATRLLAPLIVLIAVASGVAQPPGGQTPVGLPGEPVNLRTVGELQRMVSGEFIDPTAEVFLAAIRTQTGLRLSLIGSVTSDIPIQGYTKFKDVPAWVILEQLARNKYLQGSWRKVGDEYQLFAAYRGPPPPRPPPVPPKVIADITGEAEPSPAPSDRRLVWLLGVSALLAVLAACVLRAGRFVKARIDSFASRRS